MSLQHPPNGFPKSESRKKIFGVGPVQGAFKQFEELKRDFDVHLISRGSRQEVMDQCKEVCSKHGPFEAAFILFSNAGYQPIDDIVFAALWENGNNVGCFAQCGTGYDNVIVSSFTNRKCSFTNTPNAVTESTSDFTVLLFLSVLRGSTYCEMTANKGLWHKGLELTTDPRGLTLGIFGMGRIGKDFVQKVRAFGVNIIYNTRTPLSPELESSLGVKYVSKSDILSSSDVIACLVPSIPSTFHLLDFPEFEQMKQGVFIINSSRGTVINEQALIDNLKNGKVKRAALDVFEFEPEIPDYYKNNPRVTIMPHVAAYTDGTIIRGESDAFNNCRAFLETGKPVTPVNGPF